MWLCLYRNAPDAQNIGKYYEHADYVSHTDTKEGLLKYIIK
ncbi:MAG: hypothetical protein R2836_05595 [Chitinophagales bacterium]